MQTLPKLNAPFNLEARSMPMRTLNKNTLEKMEEYIQRYCIEKDIIVDDCQIQGVLLIFDK